MAVEGVMVRDGNSVAGADFSNTAGLAGPSGSGQFLCVRRSSAADRTILLAASAGAAIDGILQNKPKAGEAADVCYSGISKVVYGGTVAANDVLKNDSSGRLVTASTGNIGVAKAIVAGVLGDVATVEVYPTPISAP